MIDEVVTCDVCRERIPSDPFMGRDGIRVRVARMDWHADVDLCGDPCLARWFATEFAREFVGAQPTLAAMVELQAELDYAVKRAQIAEDALYKLAATVAAGKGGGR